MASRSKKRNPELELREEEVIKLHDALVAIPDNRKEKKPRYELAIMLVILVYSTLCGNIGGTGANRYFKSHDGFFMNLFKLNCAPAATTFNKVIDNVDKVAVAEVVEAWVKTCSLDIKERYSELCEIHAFEKAERESIQKIELELRDQEVDSLSTALKYVPDYRKPQGIRYPLIALIVMMIYAALSGFTDSKEIVAYVRNNRDYFTRIFNLKSIPSHDTFDRVKAFLHPMKLAIPLTIWIRSCFPDTRARFNELLLLHVDGKAQRGAAFKQYGEFSPYLMNAMYEGESIGLKMLEIGPKMNETGMLIQFLAMFNLNHTIVSADSAATNGPLINYIVENGGNYVFPIKGNQGKIQETILNAVKELQSEPAKHPQPGVETMFDECRHVVITPKKEHGREEIITCTLIPAEDILGTLYKDKPFLKSAANVAIIDKVITRMENGETVVNNTRRLFIVSLKDVTPEDVRTIVASHWNIEMQHWLLDIHLREDRMTARKGYAMHFGAMLRRLGLTFWKIYKNTDIGKLDKGSFKDFLIDNQYSTSRIENILKICTQSVDAFN